MVQEIISRKDNYTKTYSINVGQVQLLNKNYMNDIMLDIETLDTEGYPVILSIAAVEFDITTGGTGDEFYKVINLRSSLDHGFNLSADTLLWWMEKDELLRKKFCKDSKVLFSIKDALVGLDDWFSDWSYRKQSQVWGRGPSFDQAILRNAYRKLGFSGVPWNVKNERCVRTMEMLYPEIKANHVRTGMDHDPSSDCKNQIAYVCEIYKRIKGL